MAGSWDGKSKVRFCDSTRVLRHGHGHGWMDGCDTLASRERWRGRGYSRSSSRSFSTHVLMSSSDGAIAWSWRWARRLDAVRSWALHNGPTDDNRSMDCLNPASETSSTHRPFWDCIERCCACMCLTCDSTYCPSRFSSATLEMGICRSCHWALSFSTMELASFATSLS
jgi:hypothetical protein